MTATSTPQLNRTLSLQDAVGVVICAMIGSGIFIVSSQTAAELHSGTLLLLAWIISGILTLLGALAFGELAALWPNAGGQYTYIKNTWGQPTAFVYGWTLSFVIKAGSIAAVGLGFARFLGVFLPVVQTESWRWGEWEISLQKLVAVLLIVGLTFLNATGVKRVARLQNWVTITNVAALSLIIVAGLALGYHQPVLWQNLQLPSHRAAFDGAGIMTLGMSLVGPLFALDGWNNVTFLAAEIRHPTRNLPLSLLLGVGLTTLLYVLINGVYLAVLPLSTIIHAPRGVVGSTLMNAVLGHSGEMLIAGMIMIAAFGCVNSMILGGSRAIYALAEDGLLWKSFAGLGKQSHVPENALWIQCAWSVTLVLTRAFSELLDYMVFAAILFYAVTVAGLFIVRRRQETNPAETPPSYRAWGYPVLPIIFCLLCAWIEISLLLYKPFSVCVSLVLMLLGIPVYYAISQKAGDKTITCANEINQA
jgi:APA family basic amino acid/polyamine antiporter